MKISPIKVELLDHMGTDLDVVNAARVSFSKESEYDVEDGYATLSDKDVKLIKYLAEHNHWSPFSHCFVKFRVKAPIFIARQLQKHTVGLAWNEVSRRYVDYEPEFYFPDVWRKRADNVKQGSSDEEVNINEMWTTGFGGPMSTKQMLDQIHSYYTGLYDMMLERGHAPEQARMILPQNTMTSWIWSGSLYAFARVCNLRLGAGAQKEAGEVAQQIKNHLCPLFPVSTQYLLE